MSRKKRGKFEHNIICRQVYLMLLTTHRYKYDVEYNNYQKSLETYYMNKSVKTNYLCYFLI